MLPFFGLLARAKAVYEWFNFTNDTVSMIGVVKRAAAATATVAVMATRFRPCSATTPGR